MSALVLNGWLVRSRIGSALGRAPSTSDVSRGSGRTKVMLSMSMRPQEARA